MLKNELIKLITNRMLIVVMIIMLLLQAGLIYWNQLRKEGNIKPDEYNSLVRDVESYSVQDALEYVSDKLEHLEIIQMVMIYSNDSELLSEWLEGVDIEAIMEEYSSGEYLKYTEDILSEQRLLEEFAEELKAVDSYDKTVGAVISNTERYMNRKDVEENSFDYRRAAATKEKYERLADITPGFYPAKGIALFVNNSSVDYFIFAIMIFATVSIITMEREKGLTLISKTTGKGGSVHGMVKAASLGILCIIASILMHVVSFAIINTMYPTGDLTVPIQAVSGYTFCALEVNILQYLFIHVLMKTIYYLMFTAVFYLLCSIFRRSIPVYFAGAVTVGVLLVLYTVIKPTSYLAFINVINPITYGDVSGLLNRYQFVKLFETPVDKNIFGMVFLTVIIIICVAAGTVIYAVSEEREKKTAKIRFFIRNSLHVGVFRHEAFKVFVAEYVVVILAIAVAASYLLYSPAEELSGGIEGVMYDYYSENVIGEYTDDIMEYISTNMEEERAELDKLYMGVETPETFRLKSSISAYERMERYAMYLSQKEASYYVNNDGFVILTGGDEDTNEHNIIIMIMMIIFASICFISVMTVDYQNGEDRLVRSTISGGRIYRINKLIIGLIIAVIVFAIFRMPDLISTLNKFGTQYAKAPAYSLMHLADCPKWLSIGGYIAITYAFRFVIVCGLMGLSYLTATKTRSKSIAIILVWMVTILPLILYITF